VADVRRRFAAGPASGVIRLITHVRWTDVRIEHASKRIRDTSGAIVGRPSNDARRTDRVASPAAGRRRHGRPRGWSRVRTRRRRLDRPALASIWKRILRRWRTYPAGTRMRSAVRSGETNETMHQCTECGWSMDGNDQATEVERNRRAIEHHIETGHAVVSRSPPPKRGSADERSEGRHQAVE
jgi:hypothetical protein